MRWDDNVSPAANIRVRLAKRLRKYIAIGNASFDHKKSWSELHEFRLHTKRMRYTLELFSEFYGPHYAELIDRIRRVQTILGDVNDLIAARKLLKGVDDAGDLREEFRERAHRKLAKARTFWRSEFSDAGAARWLRYLKTQARMRTAA